MSGDLRLSYQQPAATFDEVLPLGNGALGAMVWGTVDKERISLNEGTLWSGYKKEKNNPNALAFLPKARALVFQGEYAKAQELIEKQMLGEYTESYMPLGDLNVICHTSGESSDYVRLLNLNNAQAKVSYTKENAKFSREYFISNPDKAMILRFGADGKPLDLHISFDSQLRFSASAGDGALLIEGQCPEHVDPSYKKVEEPIIWGDKGMRFSAVLRVLETDSEVSCEDDALHITGGNFAVLSFTAVNNPDLRTLYQEIGAGGLLARHLADYQKLFGRVELDLGPQLDIPTDERIKRLRGGRADNGLFALYFQFGRYLMISASRQGGTAMNLQGLWNWEIRPPWSSNYTTNINTQMNYWPALSCGLKECIAPYFDFLEKVIKEGKKTAAIHFGCRGFCLGHNTDYWHSTHPVGVVHGQREATEGSGRYAFFPLGGAWLCQELWRYYAYTGDAEFLKNKAYPMLREAALFCLDFLVEHEGWFMTCPSTSPENAFTTESGETASIAYASTIDMTIIREVFGDFEKMCQVLNIQDELLKEIEEKKERLYPFKTGRFGQLLEWAEDFDEPEPGHRHLSHLYGLFPSELFYGQADLIEACRKSIRRRIENGGGHTGWSCAWLINLYAVLGDEEEAYKQLHTLLVRSTYPNLWDGHPPFQIDGNFGGTAGIANMLVQDRGGEVVFLPALPKQFSSGCVKGLRIKGGKAVDMKWESGKLVEKRVYQVLD